MNNALLYLGGFLVMTLALLFAVPYFVDWNSYRGVFEEQASRVLGREVRVSGAVNLRLLPSPYVRFEKIRIADSTGDGGSSIFRADSFTMWLSVPPLLRGMLEANRVELKRPVIQLAVDKAGNGNWRTLALNPVAAPFMPTDVALQSVEIIDGVVALSGPNWVELARFEGINGELVAEALEGPYKFKGTLKSGGGQRAVRIATAHRETNGDIRFKAAVDAIETANSYVLDGRLSDLTGTPRLEGELAAKLRLGLKSADGAAAADVPPETAPAAAATTPQFDLRAKVNADAVSLKLTDIAVTLEQGGPPQLITGSAKLAWADKIHLNVQLASRWLDLDALAGAGASPVPLQSARAFFENLAALLPAESDTEATLDFDQLNLGGEALGNVHLAASRAGGPLKLTGLRANLPGGTRLDLDGVLTTGQKAPRLDGSLALSGQSLLRFLSWGFREKGLGEGRADGPFAIEGQFGLGEDSIELVEATAELEGMPLAGEARLALGARKKLTLALEGARIDAGQVHPGLLDPTLLGSIFLAATPPPEESDAVAAPAPGALGFLDPASTDISLKLKVAEIVDGSRTLRDVNAEIGLDRGRLSVPVLKFSTPEGLAIEAEGDATGLPAKPDGAMRALISVPSPAAAQSFAGLFGFAADDSGPAGRFADLAPARLAGSLVFHADRAPATEITLDGTMQGGRVRANVRLDGVGDEWRLKPVDISASADSPDVAHTLAAAFGGARRGAGDQTVAKPGHFVVKASGTPSTGMLSLAAVAGEGLNLEFNGLLTVPQAGPVDIGGEVRVAVADAQAALALAGLGIGSAGAAVPLDGVVRLAKTDGVLTLASDALVAGNSTLRGTVTVASKDNAPRVVTADIETPEATVAGLLAPLVGGPAQFAVPQPEPASRVTRTNAIPTDPIALEIAPIWPEQPFDLGALSAVDGHLKLRVASLAIEPGLSIADARIDARFGANGVTVEKFEGQALGGTLSSKLDFEKAPAGVALTGSLRIDVASKAPQPDAPPAPGDVAAFNVDFTGRALSPAALVTALTGKGEVALGDASLSGMSPTAVSAVAEAALAGTGPAQGEPLAAAVKAALKQGELKLGKINIPVELRDGALKLNQVTLETGDGRATFVTAIELPTMTLDSVWQIEPKVDGSAAPAAAGAAARPKSALLPAVTVVYIGKVKDLAGVEPTVTTAALERELTVRKMERDVGELERLRRLDQARAREEQQRQRALDAERLRNTPVPPQGADTPPGAPAPSSAAPLRPPGPSGAAAPSDGPTDPNAAPADAATADPADPGVPPSADTANVIGPDGLPAGAAAEGVSPPGDAPAQRARKRRSAEPWKPWSLTPY